MSAHGTAAPPTAPAPIRPRRPRIRRLAHEPDAVVMPPPRRTFLDAPVRGEIRPWAVRTETALVTGDTSPPNGPVGSWDVSGSAGSASGPVGVEGPAGAAEPVGPAGAVRVADPVRPERAATHAGCAPGATDAEVHRLATGLVRRMVEVLAGRRAPEHLAGVAQPHVVRYLRVSRDSGRTTRQATPPRRVHLSQPTPDSAEITAVCRFGTRARALTVRLDRDRTTRHPAWQASAVRLL